MYDMIILGAGTAGLSAAIYGVRSGLSVLVIEKNIHGGQIINTPDVENYPGILKISGFEFIENLYNQVISLGVKVVYETIKGLDLRPAVKTVVTSQKDYQAKTVIIANGAKHRHLNCPGEEKFAGKGVSYCATCDGMMYKDKDVIIVGGGNSAIADALYLEKICKSVTLIHRRDELRASKVYARQLENSTIHFVWNSRVKEILADKKVTGAVIENLKTKETQTINAQGLFVAIGRIPDTAIFQEQLMLNKAGYIVADETTRTNIPGVFAIGDVREKPLRQIVTAVSDGAVASKFVDEFLAGFAQ